MLRVSPSGVNSCTIESAPAASRQEARGHAEEDGELATREEIADQMAGMTLFADLALAQMSGAEEAFPAGGFGGVVVGRGPGAPQRAYCLSRHGIDHAVISADPSPGGMFRRWPFFQRLLSWTKPYAPAAKQSREFERWDWNSL